MFESIDFEISGICNAKCPWCCTGNGSQKSSGSKFITSDEFEKAIKRLISIEIINPETCINLYNWGEPLLNPEILNIINILNKYKIKFTISTNGSKFVKFNENHLQYLQNFKISFCGFSQESYNKIHGLNFNTVLRNTDKFINILGPNKITIAFHLYQFNIGELSKAYNYFKSRRVEFFPYAAYFNDFNLAMSFLSKKLDQIILYRTTEELLLFYVPELLSRRPSDYRCPQFDRLVIDENCNVLTCCVLPKNNACYSIGSLFELSKTEIIDKKLSQNICNQCNKMGWSYWAHNVYQPDFVQTITKKSTLDKIKTFFS